MNTDTSTLAPGHRHEVNARLFDDLLDDGLIEPREHVRAARRPLDHVLGSKAEALAALVCNGAISRKRFATIGVRAHAERRLLRGQERLQIVQTATELVARYDAERAERQAARGRSTGRWLGDMCLSLFVVFAFLV